METSGEATLNVWSRDSGMELGAVLPEVLPCAGSKPEPVGLNAVRCARALRKEGLSLAAVLNLAPLDRELANIKRAEGIKGIDLHINHPRLGFASISVPMTDDGNGFRVNWSAQFAPGDAPATITVRFGYLPHQLFGIYLPLLALAIALTLIATLMSRAGYAPLAHTAILLGTMIWMAAAAQLNAEAPLRILLFGSPLAGLAALFVNLWPPLICVAFGIRLGSRMRCRNLRSRTFGEVFSTYAILPLILTSVLGAIAAITGDCYFAAAGWLIVAPLFLLFRRVWNRVRARSSTRLVTAGELKERISTLAARVGRPQTKIYISLSARSQVANAFALPGKAIILNAPLIKLLNKREVDAVAAHELSHTELPHRAAWMALLIAMLVCEVPGRELVDMLPGGLAVAIMVPIAMVFFSLHGSRKREFAADASAAALTGDPRAMISSLEKIARHNDTPLASARIAEWFSSHPSTLKRIQALAGAARLQPADVEAVCAAHDA
ncbi:MAG: M48 family metallopeptidase, partial [Terracidiphilus sp.]